MLIDERTLRVADAAAQVDADWALLSAAETVCYATGYEVPIETGPSPFQGGPPLALVGRDAISGLVVTNIELVAAESGYATTVVDYEGFSDRRQPPLSANYLAALQGLMAQLGGVSGVVAVEGAVISLGLIEFLREAFSQIVDFTEPLTRARATKTEREVEQLRHAAAIVSHGQRVAQAIQVEGRTELAAFGEIRAAMEVMYGSRMPMTGDYITGITRTAQYEGWPNDRIMRRGDPIICDLSPRADGYWGDSCDTLVIGDPSSEFLELYDVAMRAMKQAVQSVRPGVSAGLVASEVSQIIEASGYNNPLHIGHGIGTSFHEFPKVVVEETALLEPGMVLMMEPGACREGVGGARLEWMFEVTETGNRILTDFEFGLA
jgi:Xaa-Pro dipeptidase